MPRPERTDASRPLATATAAGGSCWENVFVSRGLLAGMLALLAPAGARAAVHLDPIGSFAETPSLTSLPNNADRLLVVEQGGTIQLVEHGVVRLFLDLKTPGLVAAGGE